MGIGEVHDQLNVGLEKLADGERFTAPTKAKLDNGDTLADMHDKISALREFYRGFRVVANELSGDLALAAGQHHEAATAVASAVEGLSTDASETAHVGTSDMVKIVEEMSLGAGHLAENIDGILMAVESLNHYAEKASRLVIEMAVAAELYEQYHPATVEAIHEVIRQTD